MSDIIDIAAEREQFARDIALRAHRERQQPRVSDGLCCDCGDAIPQSRLQANIYAERCIDCQQLIEKEVKHFVNNN